MESYLCGGNVSDILIHTISCNLSSKPSLNLLSKNMLFVTWELIKKTIYKSDKLL